MVKVINENLLNSKENFILNIVNCSGDMNTVINQQIITEYPHIDIQYRKYLQYCRKNNINPMGTCQYIPKDSWAVGLVDTMKNDDIYSYDEPYQFIVNIFVDQSTSGGKPNINLSYLEMALKNVRRKAKAINASISIPYGIEFVGDSAKWKKQWIDVLQIIHKVFDDYKKDILIYQSKKGN